MSTVLPSHLAASFPDLISHNTQHQIGSPHLISHGIHLLVSCHVMSCHITLPDATLQHLTSPPTATNSPRSSQPSSITHSHSQSQSTAFNIPPITPLTPPTTPTYIPLPDFRSRPYMHLQLRPTHPTLLPCSYQLCIATPTRTISTLPSPRWRAECTSSFLPSFSSTNPISLFPSSHPASSGR